MRRFLKHIGALLLAQMMMLPSWAAGQALNSDDPVSNEIIVDDFERALMVLRTKDVPTITRFLHAQIALHSFYCGTIADYQLVIFDPQKIAVKVRCLGMPLYALMFVTGEKVQVFGGDGLVSVLSKSDGPIISVPVNSRPASPVTAVGVQDQDVPIGGQETQGWDSKKFSPIFIMSIVFNILVALIVLSVFYLDRRSARTQPNLFLDKYGSARLNSADKNSLIAESVELVSNLHRHPSGIYIARGRRGKRRLFTNIIAAVLYRKFGLKWRELGS